MSFGFRVLGFGAFPNREPGPFSISNSALFNDGDTDYLEKSRTFQGNDRVGTIAFWVKRATLGATQQLFHARDSGTSELRFNSGDTLFYRLEDSAGNQVGEITSNRLFRDPHAWYHITVNFDTTNATSGNRMRMYINGAEETDISEASVSFNAKANIGAATSHFIGATHSPGDYFDGYLAQYIYVDGQQLLPTTFGEFDTNGVWKPKDISAQLTDSTSDLAVSTTSEALVNSASDVSSSDLTTYSFANIALGTASSTRAIYVFTTGQGPASSNFDVSSLTVGGVQIAQGTGTPIGNMTAGGGLAAAFDGDIENYNAGAQRNATSGNIGKDFGSGVTKTVTGVVVKMLGNASVDGGAGTETMTLTVERSDNGTDFTQIFTESSISVASGAVITRKTGFSNTAAARYARISISHSGGAETHVSELEFYEGTVVTATQVADVTNSTEAQYVSELWRADVPNDTNGDIIVTWNSAMSQCGVIAWAVTGDHYIHDFETDLSNSTSSVTLSNVPDNSVILAGRGTSASATHTWSSNLTENVDEAIEGSVRHSGASTSVTTGPGQDFAITCTPSSTDSRARMFAMALSPKQGIGPNGFYLEFDDSNNIGSDSSVDSVTAPTKTFLSSHVDNSNATTYTFSSVSFGSAADNRSIVVGISGGRATAGARSVSSVTIGGVAAIIAAEQDSPSNRSNLAAIAFAKVPTGTSGDIVVTFTGGTMIRAGIGVWSATDLGPVLDTSGDADDANADLTSTLIGSRGAIAFYHLYDEGDISGVSFSNATERYEDLSATFDDSTDDPAQAGADYTFTSSGSVSVVATLAGNGNDGALIGVAFGRVGENQFIAK